MKIHVRQRLPYVTVTLTHLGESVTSDNVLLDTGSAGTVFSVDLVSALGLVMESDDAIHRIQGVGGSEFVFTKRVGSLQLDKLMLRDFQVELGAMDYGVALDGIIGMDFLTRVGATIDLQRLEIF